MLRSVFDRILLELKYSERRAAPAVAPHSRAVSSIIEYVEEHFTESITAERIARELHFSETYVSHRFKDEMGITLYQYLLKKKLVHAYALIRSGTPATEAAQSCGFSDYSSFFRAYRSHFGHVPREDAGKNGQ